MIFAPITQDGLQIAEFNMEEIFALVQDETKFDNWHVVEVEGEKHRVNLGSDRYFVLKKNRVCSCCGLHGTRMYLDTNAQQTQETGKPCFHFNVYAVNTDEKGNVHLVLMVKDHIVARSEGGADSMENYQTLCFNCNCLKDNTGMSNEQMRKAIFPAYRVYKATMVLNKTKELLEPHRSRVEKLRRAARNISDALKIVTDERVDKMKDKMVASWSEAEWLEKQCNTLEVQAQVLGAVPDIEKWLRGLRDGSKPSV